MSLPEAPTSCGKNILKYFLLHSTSIYMSMFQIFKILFQTGNTNIFVLHGVFFSRYAQLKSTFSDEVALQSCS